MFGGKKDQVLIYDVNSISLYSQVNIKCNIYIFFKCHVYRERSQKSWVCTCALDTAGLSAFYISSDHKNSFFNVKYKRSLCISAWVRGELQRGSAYRAPRLKLNTIIMLVSQLPLSLRLQSGNQSARSLDSWKSSPVLSYNWSPEANLKENYMCPTLRRKNIPHFTNFFFKRTKNIHFETL